MFAIFVGLSVVANDHLNKTKGRGTIGFGFIALGFGMAFAIPLVVFGFVSAHLNPAMSLALFVLGKIDIVEALVCIGGEFAGMFVGAIFTYLLYYPHFQLEPHNDLEISSDDRVINDQKRKLAVFATGPAVKVHWLHTFFVEVVCTTTLITGALGVYSRHAHLSDPTVFAMYRNLEGLTIGWLVFVLVLALGGVTSIAANPSRDFSPRLVHWLMPIANKGTSNWTYAWIPVVAPFVGGVAGAYLFQAITHITGFGV
jgi:glycerol uptake facilitator protein